MMAKTFLRTALFPVCVAACYVSLVAIAEGQQIGMAQLPPGPYYVGEPIEIQVIAKGIQDGRQPNCQLQEEPASGIQVQGPQINQSMSRYMQFGGGRTVTKESANYGFSFIVTAMEAGEFEVGPFTVEHAGKKRLVAGKKIRFEELANDPDMSIEIELGADKIYVGQRIPVTIQWAFAPESSDGLQFAYDNLQIRCPLFDRFTFEDAPQSRTEANLVLATASREVRINAKQAQKTIDGRAALTLTAKRTMIADSIGDFEQIPVACRTKKGSRFRQSFFQSSPTRVTPSISSGNSLNFSVLPLPEVGRPESFAGAVGSGFTMEVAVNRSVVRVGDPISLGISIQGDGNLKELSLPSLAADGGMLSEQFQLPNEPLAGNFDGRTKQFKVSVRVKDETISQIPALAFSWFDPEQEKYVMTRSKPIALQVMPAQLVTASDVVASTPAATPLPTVNVSDVNPMNVVIPHGANLAIEQDPAKLLTRGEGIWASNAVKFGSYALGVVAILVAVIVRRRGELDPAVAERKQQVQAWRRQITDAKSLSGKEAAEQIASALRKFAGVAGEADRKALNDLIRKCEDAIYAPAGSTTADSSLVTEALTAVDHLT